MLEGIILGLHLFSHHAPNRDQNNVNPGIYFETKDGWTGGLYHNSIRRTTAYFGHNFAKQVGPHTFGVSLGLATGYKKQEWTTTSSAPCKWNKYCICTTTTNHTEGFSNHEVTPAGAFYYKFAPIKVSYIPKIKDHSSVVHLGVERSF